MPPCLKIFKMPAYAGISVYSWFENQDGITRPEMAYLITNRVPLLSFAPETATPALKAALIAALSM